MKPFFCAFRQYLTVLLYVFNKNDNCICKTYTRWEALTSGYDEGVNEKGFSGYQYHLVMVRIYCMQQVFTEIVVYQQFTHFYLYGNDKR